LAELTGFLICLLVITFRSFFIDVSAFLFLQTLINSSTQQFGEFEDDLSDNLEGFMGVGDDSWEDWEEWMGFEGAGTLDFSNHINPNL
jgi:hypothetical protein